MASTVVFIKFSEGSRNFSKGFLRQVQRKVLLSGYATSLAAF